ncbi:MAG TPA: DsbA family protein [Rhizomicrobium sp.]|nr:DsbA family protein [Rhizomicrobium sp.]
MALRIVCAVFGLAAAALAVAAAPLPADPRAAKAVQDYLRQQQADDSKDRDERVAAHLDALADNPGSPVMANPQGDITIVEFFDYTCPYCKAAEPRLMRLVDGDKRVKLVMKEFPILTPVSLPASRMALAAAKQGKYRAFHLAMMRREGQWNEADILETAKAVGVDVNRARREMYAPDITDEIIANFNLARAVRVFQTPAYIVGGHLVTGDSADINFPREVARAKAENQHRP